MKYFISVINQLHQFQRDLPMQRRGKKVDQVYNLKEDQVTFDLLVCPFHSQIFCMPNCDELNLITCLLTNLLTLNAIRKPPLSAVSQDKEVVVQSSYFHLHLRQLSYLPKFSP